MEEGLIGALIGGLLTIAAQFVSERIRLGSTSRNLAVALAAEASAVAEVVRRRQWLEGLADVATCAENGEVFQYSVHLPAELLTCSRAAAAQAGTLPGRLPALVARFVMLADAGTTDIRRLADFPVDDARGLLSSQNPRAAVALYSELIAVIVDTLWTCDMIVLEVKSHYPKETAALPAGKPTRIEEITRSALAGNAA